MAVLLRAMLPTTFTRGLLVALVYLAIAAVLAGFFIGVAAAVGLSG